MKRYCVSLFISTVALILTSISGATAQENPIPAPTGTYGVGVQWRHWTDESRVETLDEAPHGQREVMVKFLYPIDDSDVATAPYSEEIAPVSSAFSELMGAVGIDAHLEPEHFAGFESHASANAPLSGAQDTYPVLIFSHGAGGEVSMYTTQLEELASHGYIVAAINHAYGAAATVFPDGRIVTQNMNIGLEDAAPIWSEDQIFVIDRLEQINQDDPEGVFTDRLDLSKLGVFGHSLGGAAATITCFEDSRCKAGVNEDGPVFGEAIGEGLAQPFLYMLSDAMIFADATAYRETYGPYYQLAISGFEHFNFGDWVYWTVAPAFETTGWLGEVKSNRSVEITRAYLVSFFDKYLKGTDGELLEGASAEYPEATLTHQNVS